MIQAFLHCGVPGLPPWGGKRVTLRAPQSAIETSRWFWDCFERWDPFWSQSGGIEGRIQRRGLSRPHSWGEAIAWRWLAISGCAHGHVRYGAGGYCGLQPRYPRSAMTTIRNPVMLVVLVVLVVLGASSRIGCRHLSLYGWS